MSIQWWRLNILLYKSTTACLFERKTVLSMGPIFSSCVENITLGIPWNLANRSFPCKLFWDEKMSQPLDRGKFFMGFSFSFLVDFRVLSPFYAFLCVLLIFSVTHQLKKKSSRPGTFLFRFLQSGYQKGSKVLSAPSDLFGCTAWLRSKGNVAYWDVQYEAYEQFWTITWMRGYQRES